MLCCRRRKTETTILLKCSGIIVSIISLNFITVLFQVLLHLIFVMPVSNSDVSTGFNNRFRLVQVLFRHGDRSPASVYPTDPYQESTWPQGLGQLSQTGMRQEYNLGQYLRTRYDAFLNSTYILKEVRVRSTNYDRTLMSAQTVLAGLYPPSGRQLWNASIIWQPIPVHTRPKQEDYLLYASTYCPKFQQLHDDYMANNSWLNKVKKENEDLTMYVSHHAGVPNTFEGLLDILDAIFCEETHNRTLPEWVTNGTTFKQLMDLRVVHTNIFVPTREMAKLRGGSLLGQMVWNMQQKVLYQNITQKMFVYSAHDTTVNSLLNALGLFNHLVVPYTGCVMVELVDMPDTMNGEELGVQIYYRNDSKVSPYLLPVKGCSNPCPLDKFAALMKPYIPVDIKKECGITNDTCVSVTVDVLRPTSITIALTVLVSLMVLMLVAVMSFCCLKSRKGQNRNRDTYRRVPNNLQYLEYKDEIPMS